MISYATARAFDDRASFACCCCHPPGPGALT